MSSVNRRLSVLTNSSAGRGRQAAWFAESHGGEGRIASSIVRPSVVAFLELSAPGRGDEVDLEEIRIEAGSAVVGKTIRSVEEESPRVRIVALKRGPGAIS